MAGLLNDFNIKTNIWDISTNLILVPEFKDLYDRDNTKNHWHSSQVMWAIAMLVDQGDANRLRNLPDKEKKQIIETEILKVKNAFEWDKRQPVIDAYMRTQMTVNERALYALKEKMQQRSVFLLETGYTMDNARDLDFITTNSEKMFKTITMLEKLIESEKKAGGELKGGRKKNISERGLI